MRVVASTHAVHALSICGLICTLGCSKPESGSPRPGAVDFGQVKVTAIEPPPGTVLKPGSHVQIVASVEYDVTVKEECAVYLVIQDEQGKLLISGSDPSVPTPYGNGTARLEYELEVPVGSKKVIVSTPLIPRKAKIGSSTRTVASQEYVVAAGP